MPETVEKEHGYIYDIRVAVYISISIVSSEYSSLPLYVNYLSIAIRHGHGALILI